jgi:hypothetical protein
MVGYNYTGLRRWAVGAFTSYDRGRSIANVDGTYGTLSATASLSRQLSGPVHFIANYSVRSYDSADFNRYNRMIHQAMVGIGFTPGAVPLRIW